MTFNANMKLAALAITASGALSACAAISRTRPHDMTAAEHEQAATTAEAKGASLAAAAATPSRTASYERVAAQSQRDLAVDHRRAARVLREEAETACRGVPSDQTIRPLGGLPVTAVAPLREAAPRPPARGYFPVRLTGAAVSVRSRGTLDSDTLEGILRCGLARAAASAENGPGVADPIAVSGASARIRPAADKSALTVEFRSLDPDRAAEILRRAQALARSEL